MHDVVIVGIPLLAILAGILFGRQDTSALRTEMNNLRADMNRRFDAVDARIDTIHRDLREFYYAEQARHDERISRLEQQQK